MRTARGRRGFTLIELLIVIIIMMILVGASFLLYGAIFRGSALWKSYTLLSEQAMNARQNAARLRRTHFLYFDLVSQNTSDPGAPQVIRIRQFIDTNNNAVWDAGDQVVDAAGVTLPPAVQWVRNPAWYGIMATGQVLYPSGYTWTQRNAFETAISGQASGFPANTVGDLVLELKAEKYRLYVDLEESSGVMRKAQFFSGQ